MKLLHFADLHLGVENYGRSNPATGFSTRLEDFLRVLDFLVDTAIEERADAVLFAGDAYRSSTPAPVHERELAARIARLSQRGIPTVLLAGNHDLPVAFGKASPLEVFRALEVPQVWVVTRPEVLEIETPSGPMEVVALPWPTRHALMTQEEYRGLSEERVLQEIEERCSAWLREWQERPRSHGPRILLAHLHFQEALLSGTERGMVGGRDPLLPVSSVRHRGFDYVALGHVHRHQDLNPMGHPHVVYSGSPERVDFGEEKETKGFCWVELEPRDGEWITTYRFVPTPARRFLTIEVDVGEAEDATEPVLRAIEREEVRGAIVRVIYRFRRPQGVRLERKRVEEALKEAAWVAGMMGRSEAPMERPLRGTFRGGETPLDALRQYIEARPEWKKDAEDLLRLGRELEREIQER